MAEDDITIDFMKETVEKFTKIIVLLISKCLGKSEVQYDWNNTMMTLLYKKGENKIIRNCRSASFKIFSFFFLYERFILFSQKFSQHNFNSFRIREN